MSCQIVKKSTIPAVPFVIPVDSCFIPTSIAKVVNVALCKMSFLIISVTRYLRIISVHCNREANLIWNLFGFQSRCNAAHMQAGLFSGASIQCIYKFCTTGPFMRFPSSPFKPHSPHVRLNDVCPVLYIFPVVLQKFAHLTFN